MDSIRQLGHQFGVVGEHGPVFLLAAGQQGQGVDAVGNGDLRQSAPGDGLATEFEDFRRLFAIVGCGGTVGAHDRKPDLDVSVLPARQRTSFSMPFESSCSATMTRAGELDPGIVVEGFPRDSQNHVVRLEHAVGG